MYRFPLILSASMGAFVWLLPTCSSHSAIALGVFPLADLILWHSESH